MPAELSARISIRIAALASGEGAVALGAGRSQRQLFSHACALSCLVCASVSAPIRGFVRVSCPTLSSPPLAIDVIYRMFLTHHYGSLLWSQPERVCCIRQTHRDMLVKEIESRARARRGRRRRLAPPK